MIRDVYLHGAVGRRYGRHFRLDVASPGEAVRALITLRPGLRQNLRVGYWRVVVGAPHVANSIELEHLNMRMGNQPLHLVPATSASGGGLGKVAAGVALVGATVLTAGLAAPAGVGIFAALGAPIISGIGITYGTVALLGASMALGGLSTLLTSTPAVQQANQSTNLAQRPADRPSFLFNGVTNISQQGVPVPLVFGKHLVGSVVVFAGLNAEDIA